MRKARAWWLGEFLAKERRGFHESFRAMGTQENNWMRQVSGYWEMAAALAVHGAVNADFSWSRLFPAKCFSCSPR